MSWADTTSGDRGFSVYVHWPFCVSKCPYCAFNSYVRESQQNESQFIAALVSEISYIASRLGVPRTVSSIAIGGGTPSLMDGWMVDSLLQAIAKFWGLAADVEITMEANPGSADVKKFREYRSAGVTRISLGVQALEPFSLKALGRNHTVEDALRALEVASCIFTDVSFDLIYARPWQTVKEWEAELRSSLQFITNHMSVYQLSIEPDTPYHKLYANSKLDDDVAAEMFELTRSILLQSGFPAYEISNHAKPGFESRHNINYWRYGEYVGVGPGAHGRVILDGQKYATEAEISPTRWVRLIEQYGNGFLVFDALSMQEQAQELMLLGMRLSEGVKLQHYEVLSGCPIDEKTLAFLEEQNLLEVTSDSRIRATESGFLLLDRVLHELLS